MTRLIMAATATVILFFTAAPAGAFVSVPGAPAGDLPDKHGPISRPGHDGNEFNLFDVRSAGDAGLPMIDERSYHGSRGEKVLGIYSVPPPVMTPEPAAVLLFGLGLVGIGLAGRKFPK
jgi:hypothetical protein